MSEGTEIKERYEKGGDIVYYVVYKSKAGQGNDEVLQHKTVGLCETSHITLHPDGTKNFRVKLTRVPLESAIRSNFQGYSPPISVNVRQFLSKIRGTII